MRIMRFTGALLAGLLLLTACKPAAPAQPPPPNKATINIIFDRAVAQGLGVLYGGQFRPVDVSVAVGGTVTWNNTDTKDHTVVSRDGSFNTTLQSGQSFSHTYTQNGSFDYYDPGFDGMDGTVYVVSTAAAKK